MCKYQSLRLRNLNRPDHRVDRRHSLQLYLRRRFVLFFCPVGSCIAVTGFGRIQFLYLADYAMPASRCRWRTLHHEKQSKRGRPDKRSRRCKPKQQTNQDHRHSRATIQVPASSR